MPDLDWSPQQDAALCEIQAWLKEPPTVHNQVKKLGGYAGTGKTTLAKEANAMVGGSALACAYTGKAASVMHKKGLFGASTIHSLIYTPAGDGKQRVKELEAELALLERVTDKSLGLAKRLEAVRRSLLEARENSGPQFVLKGADESAISGAPLVILDEASMVSQRMAEDLISFGVRLLVLGDPAQLPPVKGQGYFNNGSWDIMLTEIHRQAAGDPIIQLATMVRQGKYPGLGTYGPRCRVVESVSAREAQSHDQVLCGTNNKRHSINARHRQLDGRSGYFPNAGERLVCLKNNRELGLLNGTLWTCVNNAFEPEEDESSVYLRIRPEEGGLEQGLPALASIFVDPRQEPDWRTRAEQFDYGYCLTVHKSQGSQWDSVLLFDDWMRRETHKQWLYTGLTRAAEELTLVVS